MRGGYSYLGACTQGRIGASHLVRTVSPTYSVRVFLVFVLNHSGYTVVVDGLVAVALTVPLAGEVQPAVAQATAMLEEQLVEVRVADDPLEPVARHLLVGHGEVGSLAQHVLRATYATHRTVQLLAAVAAGDADRVAVVLSQGFQDFAAQVLHGQHLLVAWLVVDAEALGSDTLGEFAECEVLRQLNVILFIHSVFVFGLII